MTWSPISLADLQSMLSRDLAECSPAQRQFFRWASTDIAKWQLTPCGDQGGGFWAVVNMDRVLWYNDIEDGFNVSKFEVQGQIPGDEYWCNQDPLRWALPRPQGEPGTWRGPPDPVSNG